MRDSQDSGSMKTQQNSLVGINRHTAVKEKKGESTAQEPECLQTTEDWMAPCAALTCPNHTVILGEPIGD